MLHTKYLGSMPCGFRQEDLLVFPYTKANVKHVAPVAVHLKFSETRNVEYNEVFLLICDEDVF